MQIATQPPYYKRADFLFALALGPLLWGALGMWWPVGDISWPLRAPMQYLALSLIYPLLEEFVFRGGIQVELNARSWARWRWGPLRGSNFITSCIFALAHVVLRGDLALGLVFFPSLVFGYFRDREDSWVPAFWLHSFYNAGFVLLFYN